MSNANEPELKAYKISCRDDDHGQCVVFAENAKKVNRRWNSENCDCKFIEIRIHRVPEFDKYSPGPVTIEQYLAEGWHWACRCCGRQVWAEDNPVVVNSLVYHGVECVKDTEISVQLQRRVV